MKPVYVHNLGNNVQLHNHSEVVELSSNKINRYGDTSISGNFLFNQNGSQYVHFGSISLEADGMVNIKDNGSYASNLKLLGNSGIYEYGGMLTFGDSKYANISEKEDDKISIFGADGVIIGDNIGNGINFVQNANADGSGVDTTYAKFTPSAGNAIKGNLLVNRNDAVPGIGYIFEVYNVAGTGGRGQINVCNPDYVYNDARSVAYISLKGSNSSATNAVEIGRVDSGSLDTYFKSNVGALKFYRSGNLGMTISTSGMLLESGSYIKSIESDSTLNTNVTSSVPRTDAVKTYVSSNFVDKSTDQTILGNKTFTNNVRVNGTFTATNATFITTETLAVSSNFVTLNNNETGIPSQNAGVQVERGTSVNSQVLWNESTDRWQAGVSGSLENIVLSSELSTTNNNVTAVSGYEITTRNSLSGYIAKPSTVVSENEIVLFSNTTGNGSKGSGTTVETGIVGGSLLGLVPFTTDPDVGTVPNNSIYVLKDGSGCYLKFVTGGTAYGVEMS